MIDKAEIKRRQAQSQRDKARHRREIKEAELNRRRLQSKRDKARNEVSWGSCTIAVRSTEPPLITIQAVQHNQRNRTIRPELMPWQGNFLTGRYNHRKLILAGCLTTKNTQTLRF